MKKWKRSIFIFLMSVSVSIINAQDSTPPAPTALSFGPDTVNVTQNDAVINFTLGVADDMSGLEYLSLYAYSASGSQSSTIVHNFNGEISDTVVCPLTIKQFAEAGMWTISQIYLIDKAGNKIFYYKADLQKLGFKITFMVKSVQDMVPPIISSFSFTPDTVDVKLSYSNIKFSIGAADTASGLDYMSLYTESPSKSQSNSFYHSFTGKKTDTASFPMIVKQFSETGTWTIKFVYFADKVGNKRYYYTADLQRYGFKTSFVVKSTADNAPPVLTSFSLSPDTVNASASDVFINLTVGAVDITSGLRNFAISADSPSKTQSRSIGSWFSTKNTDTVTSALTVKQFAEAGAWKINHIVLTDNVGNDSYYYTADLQRLGFKTTFVVNPNFMPSFPDSINQISGYVKLTDTNSSGGIKVTFEKENAGLSGSLYSSLNIGDKSCQLESTLNNHFTKGINVSRVEVYNENGGLIIQSSDPTVISNNFVESNSSIAVSISPKVPPLISDAQKWHTRWYCSYNNDNFTVISKFKDTSIHSNDAGYDLPGNIFTAAQNSDTICKIVKPAKAEITSEAFNWDVNNIIASTEDTVYTDNNGYFSKGLVKGFYRIKYSKEGYISKDLEEQLLMVTKNLGSFSLSLNTAPQILPLSLPDAYKDSLYKIHLDAFNFDKDDSLIYSLVKAPKWLSIDNAGFLKGTPKNDDVGTDILLSIKVTDLFGLYDTLNTKINVKVAPPAVPVLISPANSSKNQPTDIRLSWTSSENAETYTLLVSQDTLFANSIIDDSSLTTPIKIITGLKKGVKYYWKVRSKNIGGLSSYSSVWSFTTLLPSPISLSATAEGVKKVKLIWEDKSEGEKGFILERKKENQADYTIIDTLIANTVTYIDSTVLLATTYKYRIRAYTEFISSDYSNETSVTTLTSVANLKIIPTENALIQNYPNPFNPTTVVSYSLLEESKVRLVIYNSLGQQVSELVNRTQPGGYYEEVFDASSLPSGIYIYSISAQSAGGKNIYSATKKMTLIK